MRHCRHLSFLNACYHATRYDDDTATVTLIKRVTQPIANYNRPLQRLFISRSVRQFRYIEAQRRARASGLHCFYREAQFIYSSSQLSPMAGASNILPSAVCQEMDARILYAR